MSGVAIAWYKLTQHAALTDVVPAARIKSGVLPQGTALPCISVTLVSGTTLNQVAQSSGLRMDRVQITVDVAPDHYPQLDALLALCRAALPYTRGTVNSIVCDSIVPDIEGPDGFDDLLKSYFRSQDYMITWSE